MPSHTFRNPPAHTLHTRAHTHTHTHTHTAITCRHTRPQSQTDFLSSVWTHICFLTTIIAADRAGRGPANRCLLMKKQPGDDQEVSQVKIQLLQVENGLTTHLAVHVTTLMCYSSAFSSQLIRGQWFSTTALHDQEFQQWSRSFYLSSHQVRYASIPTL